MTIEFNKIEQSSELGVKGYIVRFDRPYFDGTTRSAKEYEQGLEVFKAEGIKIPLLYLHTSEAQGGKPVGVMTAYKVEEGKGIYAEFRLNDTPFVRDEVLPAIKSGSLTHFSTEETGAPDRVIIAVALVPIGNAVTARVESENKIREQMQKQAEKRRLNFLRYLI